MSRFSEWINRKVKDYVRKHSWYSLEFDKNGSPCVMEYPITLTAEAIALYRDFDKNPEITNLRLFRHIYGDDRFEVFPNGSR